MFKKNVDYDKICRTCLSTNNLQSIFVCQNNTKLSKMIMACTSIQVQENDGLPQSICLECVENIKKFYKFKRKCVKINKTFRLLNNLLEHIKSGCKLNPYQISNDVDSTVETGKFEVEDNNDRVTKENYENMDITVHGVTEDETEYLEDDSNEEIKENDSAKITGDELMKSDDNELEEIEYLEEELIDEIEYLEDELMEEIEYLEDVNDEKSEENENMDITDNVLNEHEYFDKHGCENGLKFGLDADYLQENNDESEIEKVKTESTDVSVDKLTNQIDEVDEETKEYFEEKVESNRMKTCIVCGKKLAPRNMTYHMRIHTREQPFQCTKCGQKFSLRGNLTRHMMTHTGKRPHKCDICGKGFIQSISLREHKYKHNFKTLFLCDKCGKGFYIKASFEQHRLCHTHIKSHSCTYCGKTFKYANTLRVHSLTHTGEKPYSCHVCGKKFAQSTHVTRHLRIHTGSKPYKCNYCGKFFSVKENLTVHIRTHTGETPYVCSVCGRGFYDLSNMKRHERGHK